MMNKERQLTEERGIMMHSMIMILFTMLHLFVLEEAKKPYDPKLHTPVFYYIQNEMNTNKHKITGMKALDMVKEQYAMNFVKEEMKDTKEYYYRLPEHDYYLYCEGMDESQSYYMIHLYEFVTDDIETGIGHYVTYGWYLVNKETGVISY